MNHRLDGVWLKRDRARELLSDLEAMFETFCKNAYSSTREIADGGRYHVYRVNVRADPPTEWGPIIGDCLHNLRSALDHLAQQLAIVNTGDPLPSDIARDTHFPIYNTDVEFCGNMTKLRGVSGKAVTVMERFQPYRGLHDPDHHRLAILKRLSDRDKHRTLHANGFMLGGATYYMPDNLVDQWFSEPIRLEDQAEIARFTFNPPVDATVDMDPQFTFRIAFDGTPLGDGLPVWSLLNQTCFDIESRIIPALEPFLF